MRQEFKEGNLPTDQTISLFILKVIVSKPIKPIQGPFVAHLLKKSNLLGCKDAVMTVCFLVRLLSFCSTMAITG